MAPGIQCPFKTCSRMPPTKCSTMLASAAVLERLLSMTFMTCGRYGPVAGTRGHRHNCCTSYPERLARSIITAWTRLSITGLPRRHGRLEHASLRNALVRGEKHGTVAVPRWPTPSVTFVTLRCTMVSSRSPAVKGVARIAKPILGQSPQCRLRHLSSAAWPLNLIAARETLHKPLELFDEV